MRRSKFRKYRRSRTRSRSRSRSRSARRNLRRLKKRRPQGKKEISQILPFEPNLLPLPQLQSPSPPKKLSKKEIGIGLAGLTGLAALGTSYYIKSRPKKSEIQIQKTEQKKSEGERKKISTFRTKKKPLIIRRRSEELFMSPEEKENDDFTDFAHNYIKHNLKVSKLSNITIIFKLLSLYNRNVDAVYERLLSDSEIDIDINRFFTIVKDRYSRREYYYFNKNVNPDQINLDDRDRIDNMLGKVCLGSSYLFYETSVRIDYNLIYTGNLRVPLIIPMNTYYCNINMINDSKIREIVNVPNKNHSFFNTKLKMPIMTEIKVTCVSDESSCLEFNQKINEIQDKINRITLV